MELWLVLAGVLLGGVRFVRAQSFPSVPQDEFPDYKQRNLSDQIPQGPSRPPAYTIPVQPLGFSPPGVFYIGRHNSLASLDFLGENRLLFTFQVPGLMQRQGADSAESEERQVRAVVVSLPEGNIESEGLWTLHDRARYLWMLKDGHFLLRDQEGIQEGDAGLVLKPSMQFPGRVLWLEMDPTQQLMDTNFLAPAGAGQKPGEASGPAATWTTMTGKGKDPELKPSLVVRTVKRDSGQMVLENRVGLTVQLPIDADGYIEVEAAMLSGMFKNVQLPINSEAYLQTMRDGRDQWLLNMKYFDGRRKTLNRVWFDLFAGLRICLRGGVACHLMRRFGRLGCDGVVHGGRPALGSPDVCP